MATNIPTNLLTNEAKNYFKGKINVDVKTTDEAVGNQTIK